MSIGRWMDKEVVVHMHNGIFSSVQVSLVAQSCPTLCNPMNHSTPGLPVHHQLLEFTQTHVHGVSDAIQPSHPLSSPSPPAPNPSKHQSLFQWVNSSHEVAKVLREMQIKTTMRYHLTPVREPLSKCLQTVNAGKDVEKSKHSCTVGGNVNWHSYDGRRYFLKNYE